MKLAGIIFLIAFAWISSTKAQSQYGNVRGNDFAEPGYNSALEVKIHCERRDAECLRILEGAIGSAITMQDAYVDNYKLPHLFCLNNSPTIEDFRSVFLKFADAVPDATAQDTLRGQFSNTFLAAVIKAYPCKAD